jgi:hypothetical protein
MLNLCANDIDSNLKIANVNNMCRFRCEKIYEKMLYLSSDIYSMNTSLNTY